MCIINKREGFNGQGFVRKVAVRRRRSVSRSQLRSGLVLPYLLAANFVGNCRVLDPYRFQSLKTDIVKLHLKP
jgi:hypothetical protein